jgi:hypothetical protein
VNEDPARQDAERALDHAHVLVQHQMMDIGAVEQCTDCGNQHDIVGPDQFPQVMFSLFARVRQRHRACQPLRALAASAGTFYCRIRIVRIG